MADKKISQLTGATTPLAGTEVLPIVQGGSTVKVSVANVTAGRAVSTGALSVVGADAVLDNTFSLSGKLVAGTAVSMIRRNSSNEVAIDEDGYGTTIGFNRRFDFSGSGNLTLGIGNVIVGTAGKGIDFSANANAPGMTSELLSWYEEGTWTPTLVGGTTAGDYTVATTSAKYTRIGRQVTVTARMAITVNSAGTGTAKFGGLPFPKGADQYITGAVLTGNVTYGAGVIATVIQTWTSGSSSDFALAGVKSGTAPYDVDITDFVTGSTVVVSLTYFV